MRKLAVIALFCFTSVLAKAQKDVCKDIQKKIDPFRKSTEYRSPSLGKIDVVLTRTIIEGDILNKLIVTFNSGYSDYRKKDLFLLLDNGEVIKDEDATTDCHILDLNTFLYIGIMHIDESEIETLKNHKIVKVRIGIEEREIKDKSAIKLQSYLPCVFNPENK